MYFSFESYSNADKKIFYFICEKLEQRVIPPENRISKLVWKDCEFKHLIIFFLKFNICWPVFTISWFIPIYFLIKMLDWHRVISNHYRQFFHLVNIWTFCGLLLEIILIDGILYLCIWLLDHDLFELKYLLLNFYVSYICWFSQKLSGKGARSNLLSKWDYP